MPRNPAEGTSPLPEGRTRTVAQTSGTADGSVKTRLRRMISDDIGDREIRYVVNVDIGVVPNSTRHGEEHLNPGKAAWRALVKIR